VPDLWIINPPPHCGKTKGHTVNNTDNTDTNYITPQASELQDLWHYATAITHGSNADSVFATSSLLGRLELVESARNCIARIQIPAGNNILHPSWDDVQNHLQNACIDSEAQLVLVGLKLLDLVNEECQKQGVNGRSGEFHINDFLRGFAASSGVKKIEAAENWAEFSRQLSDAERTRIESGGYDSGWREAEQFGKLY